MDPTVLIAIAVLACPIGMGLMMWMMNRQNMGGQQGQSMSGHTSEADRLKALRDQRRLLEQEITEAEKITALEAQKEALTRAHGASSEASGKSQP
ncbi:MAG: hypothetical protein ACRDH2_14035 [Anaerolineales bacterium]